MPIALTSNLQRHKLFLLLGFLLVPRSLTAADTCDQMWDLSALVHAAKRLDQKVVCVRALLRPLPLQDRGPRGLPVYEAVSLEARHHVRVGLIDWDQELGIDESLYHGETYDLLEKAAGRCPGHADRNSLNYEVVFRAALEYKKNLTERAYQSLPPNLANERPLRVHYDVELIPLEFLKANAICE